jgi:hypothetical protein
MLFHVIPASAFTKDVLRESWAVSQQEKDFMYVPHGATGYRYNADGFLTLTSIGGAMLGNGSKAFGYTQLFRSGIIEYADSNCAWMPSQDRGIAVFGQELEKQIVNCYKHAIARFRNQGWTEALYIGFSLIGIADKSFYVN